MVIKKREEMIFGIYAIQEALLSGDISLAKIWIKQNKRGAELQDVLSLAKEQGVPYARVPLAKLTRMTKKSHQGAIAWISPIRFTPLHLIIEHAYEQGKHPRIIVLDHLQDMRNFGAIVRSAVATGVDGIVLHIHESLPITGDAVKTSAGTLLQMPICRTGNLGATLEALQHSGLQLVACSEKGAKSIYTTDLSLPTAFLFGGEHKGIHPQHLTKCHTHAHVPMRRYVDSLNISVATAVVLYESVRQRGSFS